MLKNILHFGKMNLNRHYFSLNYAINLGKANQDYLYNIHSCLKNKDLKFNYKNPEKINHIMKLKEVEIPSNKKISSKNLLNYILTDNEEDNTKLQQKYCLALEFLNYTESEALINLNDADLICKLFNLNWVNNLTKDDDWTKRAPLISIMGHVDHGKTTLLDTYRKSSIAAGEVGGITQKIGGFNVETRFGEISFIDTPGHAIFSNMRHRGAVITDIIILVISAIEGIQNQTLEVLNLIKKYNIPVIIAINKIDNNKADPEKVEEDLINFGIELEDYGGNVPCIHISAKNSVNTDLLLELILYEAQKLKITGNKNLNPEIFSLESSNTNLKQQKSTSVIVKNGTLNKGDYIIIKNEINKCLNMKNDKSISVNKGECGKIVELFGISSLPDAGDNLVTFKDEKLAKKFLKLNYFIDQKLIENEQLLNESNSKMKLKYKNRREKRKLYSGDKSLMIKKIKDRIDLLKTKLEENRFDEDGNEILNFKELTEDEKVEFNEEIQECLNLIKLYDTSDNTHNIIIKTRDYGILETIQNEINNKNYTNFNIAKIEVGPVNQSDIFLATKGNCKIYSMDVEITNEVKKLAKKEDIQIVFHNIIYKFFEDIETDINKYNENKKILEPIGSLTVKKWITLKGKNKRFITGCYVDDGKITLNSKFTLYRNNKKIKEDLKISSIKLFKDEVEVVNSGTDCGLSFINFNKFEENDILKCFIN